MCGVGCAKITNHKEIKQKQDLQCVENLLITNSFSFSVSLSFNNNFFVSLTDYYTDLILTQTKKRD